MADVKISAMPVAASANATDQLETNQAGTTRRLTNAQIATYIQTALNLLTLIGGKISLAADGSASFSNGAINIDSFGNLDLPNTTISADGSALFAGGDIQIAANGVVGFGDAVNVTNADLELFNPNQGVIQHSRPGNIRYRIVIDDAGNLGTEVA